MKSIRSIRHASMVLMITEPLGVALSSIAIDVSLAREGYADEPVSGCSGYIEREDRLRGEGCEIDRLRCVVDVHGEIVVSSHPGVDDPRC